MNPAGREIVTGMLWQPPAGIETEDGKRDAQFAAGRFDQGLIPVGGGPQAMVDMDRMDAAAETTGPSRGPELQQGHGIGPAGNRQQKILTGRTKRLLLKEGEGLAFPGVNKVFV